MVALVLALLLVSACRAEGSASVNAADYSSGGGPGQPSLLEIEAAKAGKRVNIADFSSGGGPGQPSLLEIEAARRSGGAVERGAAAEVGFKAARRRRMSVAAGSAAEDKAKTTIQEFAAQLESALHIQEQEALSGMSEVLPPSLAP